MHAKIEAMQQIIADIEALSENDDWEGLAVIDERAREVVVAAGDAAKAGEIPIDVVVMQLDVLQQTFEKARERAVKARDAAARSLRETNRTHKAAQSYLNTQEKGQ